MSESNNSTTFNTAIIPPDDVSIQAIEMSKKVAEGVESEFVLNLDRLLPHITVYQAKYPNKNIEKLKNIVRKLSSEQELFEVKLDVITVFYGTFLFWNCGKTDALQDLHQKVVRLANPLRDGLIPEQLANRRGLNEGDRYDIKTFGALLIGPRYKPHITITRLKRQDDAEKAIRILGDSKSLYFKPKALILGYLGEHGTVTGIVESFRFK